MKYYLITLGLLASIGFSGCGITADIDTNDLNASKSGTIKYNIVDNNIKNTQPVTKAFFGDKENNKVIMVDVDNMKILSETEQAYTNHKNTYTVRYLGIVPKLYVSNRSSEYIDVIDSKTLKIIKTIKLKHNPRSADAINKKLGLVAISGMDKPMVTIIDAYTDKIVATVGEDVVTGPVESHNGGHACGHPYWLDDNHFVLIDRANETITTYKIEKNKNNKWETTKLNTLETPTSAHQLIPLKNYNGKKGEFYLVCEGSDTINPSILELEFTKDFGLQYDREIKLINDKVNIADMGTHHGDFVPNSKFLYVGSKEGTMFIINYETMKIQSTTEAGKGAGHTYMIPNRNMAIIINHKDKFLTICDSNTGEKIKDIEVSILPDSAVGNKTIQAHMDYYVSKDNKYFYMFLTEEGRFIKINLDKLELIDSLFVGGKPAQGSFGI